MAPRFRKRIRCVYAAQKLSITGKPLTVNGRTYEKGFKTNGVNTVIDGTSFRLAFKVVVKKSTRVSADTSGGSKNSIFSYDETAGTYTNLTGLVPQSQTMYADLEAGTVAYIGNGGTNNSMLAVDIQKGPTPVTVTTKLTLGNAATTIPANAIVTIGDQTVTAVKMVMLNLMVRLLQATMYLMKLMVFVMNQLYLLAMTVL